MMKRLFECLHIDKQTHFDFDFAESSIFNNQSSPQSKSNRLAMNAKDVLN